MENWPRIYSWETKRKADANCRRRSWRSLLIRQMLRSPDMGLEPVLAVDDDPQKRNLAITGGVKVQGTIEDILI